MKEILSLLGALDKVTLIAGRADRLWARAQKWRARQAPKTEGAPAGERKGEAKLALEALLSMDFTRAEAEAALAAAQAAHPEWRKAHAEELVSWALRERRKR